QLLLLMGRVHTFEALAERPSLDRVAENGDGTALTTQLHRAIVGRIELSIAVTTTAELLDLLVGEVAHDIEHARILAEELLAHVIAGSVREALKLTVDGRVEVTAQHAIRVLVEQFVPLRAPDDLDDVPTSAAEDAFEFLNDLAVAAHGTVEALQVA